VLDAGDLKKKGTKSCFNLLVMTMKALKLNAAVMRARETDPFSEGKKKVKEKWGLAGLRNIGRDKYQM